jgi:hypothetical protein
MDTTERDHGLEAKSNNRDSHDNLSELDTNLDNGEKSESSIPSPAAEKHEEKSTEKPAEAAPSGQKPPPPEALERSAFKTGVIMFALCVSLLHQNLSYILIMGRWLCFLLLSML